MEEVLDIIFRQDVPRCPQEGAARLVHYLLITDSLSAGAHLSMLSDSAFSVSIVMASALIRSNVLMVITIIFVLLERYLQ